jgi:hypothetical protein
MVSFSVLGSSAGIELMIVDVRVGRKYRERVHERDASGRCVKCNQPAAKRSRGLCHGCYYAYRSLRFRLPLKERPILDARLIRVGELLPSRQGQRLTRGA